jgi:hypothetical protein
VAAHSGPGDIADGHRAQPHLLRPVQSIFWTSLAVLLPLIGFEAQRRVWLYLGASILFFLLAVHTHPTNVFVAPFLVLPVVSALRPLLPASAARRAFLAMAAAFVAALTMAAVVTALGHLGAVERVPEPALAGDRIRAPDRRKAMVRVCGKQCPTLQWRDESTTTFPAHDP